MKSKKASRGGLACAREMLLVIRTAGGRVLALRLQTSFSARRQQRLRTERSRIVADDFPISAVAIRVVCASDIPQIQHLREP
jgi:hypothetical protein